MDQLIGKVLHDRYRIQSLLGRQTGRRTLLATDLQTELPVVVKLLLFGPDFTWDDLKLFEREAEVLKFLDHSAIPQYLDYFEVEIEAGKGFALVQTYIEARSLQDWIQSGRTFSEEELKVIAKELLNILDYLHNRTPPAIHRDIKPSNILLGDRSGNSPGQIYLIDFGSVQTAVYGGTRTIVGTYGYMPFEQFGGQATPASDLYALGATLIYLATGHHPDNLPQQNLKIAFEDQVNLSPNLIDWLKRTTEPSLEQRLKSAREALQALEKSALKNLSSAIQAQPEGSRIKVRNTKQGLEILIPLEVPEFTGSIGLIMCFTYASFFMIIAVIIGVATIPLIKSINIVSFFVVIFLGGISAFFAYCSFMCAWMTFLQYLSHQRLCITAHTVTLRYELFGFRFLRLPSALTFNRQTIMKIEPVPVRYNHSFPGNTLASLPHINIWAGTQKMTLGTEDGRYGGKGSLSNKELYWLEDVLNNTLNFSATKEREK